ncbi:MAG: CsiV family protein [Woeseiaceae bacterium]
MNILTLIRIHSSLLLILLPLVSVQAQQDIPDEISEPRRYTVEMIIFQYAQEVSTGSEIFPPDTPARVEPDGDEVPFGMDDEPLEEIPPASRIYRDLGVSLLTKDQYTMNDIMSRLRRLDVYKPVMHFAWTQTTWPDEETLPIEISSMGRPPKGLNGTVRLYLSRFLHLVVDLQLDAPKQQGRPSNAAYSYDDGSINRSGSLRDPGDYGTPLPVRYRIEENRILKSGELRYFDHPKFGVLAKAMRVEDDSDDSLESADSELLGYPAE